MRREINLRKREENDDDGDVLAAAAAAAEEKGVCVKIEHLQHPLLFSNCRTWPRLKLPCCSRPSKTPHSWQQIIVERRNQRRDPSLRFHLHPFCPTRGNNKSASLLFFPSTSTSSRCFSFSSVPKKTHEKNINQRQELTLSGRGGHTSLQLPQQEVARLVLVSEMSLTS